jgi:hypothetical protein
MCTVKLRSIVLHIASKGKPLSASPKGSDNSSVTSAKPKTYKQLSRQIMVLTSLQAPTDLRELAGNINRQFYKRASNKQVVVVWLQYVHIQPVNG